MKSIYAQNKPFFNFLIKFLAFYMSLALLYKLFINQFDVDNFELDTITKAVSSQTVGVMQFFDMNVQEYPHESEASMRIVYNDKYVVRIIEGCNAMSVIILFAAFVFAFSNGFKKTFFYIAIGSVLIYLLNIARIGFLIYALYYYPQYQEFLHGTVFPLLIYGFVFFLWIMWVLKFSGYERKTNI